MDIREFAQEFQDNVKTASEMGNTDYDQELAYAILEYLEDNGEVNAPEIYLERVNGLLISINNCLSI